MKKNYRLIIVLIIVVVCVICCIIYTNTPVSLIKDIKSEEVEEIMFSTANSYYYLTEQDEISKIIDRIQEMKLYTRMFDISDSKVNVNGKIYEVSNKDIGLFEKLYNEFK